MEREPGVIYVGSIKPEDVDFIDGKYYHRKCKKEVLLNKRIQKITTNSYKKGDIILYFKHTNLHDCMRCPRLGKSFFKGHKHSAKTKFKYSKIRKGKKFTSEFNGNIIYAGRIALNDVIIRDNKYYHKKCGQELIMHEYIRTTSKHPYKKGDKIIVFKHINQNDANKCSSIGRKMSPESIAKYKKSRTGKKNPKVSLAKKGMKYKPMSIETKISSNDKRIATMKKNGTLGKVVSKSEKFLINYMLSNEVPLIHQPIKRNYPEIKYYPGRPDFYIPSINIIGEIQSYPFHGPEPYDPNNIEHQKLLKDWNNKVENGFLKYGKFINVWTTRDPAKREWCKKHNVTLVEIWNKEDAEKFIEKIKSLLKEVEK